MAPFDPSIPVPDPAEPAALTELAEEPASPGADAVSAETVRRRRRGSGTSRFSLILVAIVAGSALFLGGYSLGAHIATTPGTPAGEEARFGPFWDVYSAIQNEYAGSPRPSQDELVQAAIKGMMESLNDQWSYYQGPVDFENSLLGVGGQAEGVGVQVVLQPIDPASSVTCQTIGNGCELAVDKPIAGSPAAAAGVKPGDVIVAVDRVNLTGLSIDQASAKIKGTKGTTVTLTIDRAGSKIEISIVRQSYSLPQVDTRTLANGKVAYIDVSGVNPPASYQFDAALKQALAAGQRNFVIDLRGNPGGYVNDAVKIASEFIASGTIVYQQDATGAQTEIAATPNGRATDPSIGVVVLVDKNTASAAEIVAAALQARGRAKLIGQTTYGKGVVQEWLPLTNDFGGIHLTVARWLTPNKVWIQGKGIAPDLAVTSDGARAGTDPVLNAALVSLGFAAEPGSSPSPSPSSPPASGPSHSPAPSPGG